MKIIWLESAREQLEEILEYISQDSPLNAHKYTAELFARTNNLLQFPDIGTIYSWKGQKVVRRLVIDKTKFILYKIEKKNDHLLILSIRDTRTDWKQ